MAIPTPIAASYRITAWPACPASAPTMAASAVEINSALPRPQPVRNPTIASTEPAAPDRAEKATISAKPINRVVLTPTREEMNALKNMASAVISR